jgi:hypothetical protein
MKKIVVLLVVISFAAVVQVAGKMNYVTVGEKTYFSDDIKIGLTNVRIVTEDGITLLAPLKNVDSYMIDGKVYDRLPLVCLSGTVKCSTLMELVAFRNGLRLYKYNSGGENRNLGCCFADESGVKAMFFVYQDGELHLRVDEKNVKTVFPFFHLKIKVS